MRSSGWYIDLPVGKISEEERELYNDCTCTEENRSQSSTAPADVDRDVVEDITTKQRSLRNNPMLTANKGKKRSNVQQRTTSKYFRFENGNVANVAENVLAVAWTILDVECSNLCRRVKT